MGVAPAEKAHAGNDDQGEEVQRHQQIVRHRGRRLDLAHVELLGQGREVHAAADVGAGHHGRHTFQARNVGMQQRVGDERTCHRTRRADEEDDQHAPRLLPDAAHVALEQQKGDAQRHRIAPDDIVIQGAAGGDDAQVGRRQSDQKGDDGAGDLGGPGVALFQVNGQGHRRQKQRQKRPGILRCDERGSPQGTLKKVRQHKSILLPSCFDTQFFTSISGLAPPRKPEQNFSQENEKMFCFFP